MTPSHLALSDFYWQECWDSWTKTAFLHVAEPWRQHGHLGQIHLFPALPVQSKHGAEASRAKSRGRLALPVTREISAVKLGRWQPHQALPQCAWSEWEQPAVSPSVRPPPPPAFLIPARFAVWLRCGRTPFSRSKIQFARGMCLFRACYKFHKRLVFSRLGSVGPVFTRSSNPLVPAGKVHLSMGQGNSPCPVFVEVKKKSGSTHRDEL